MSRDPETYGSIRRRYDLWRELEERRPEREYLRRQDTDTVTYIPPGSSDMSRNIAATIGIGIGIVLLLLAGIAFNTAATWADLGRDGATVGYTLVGIFLVIAGGGGIVATWNHNFRVLAGSGSAH